MADNEVSMMMSVYPGAMTGFSALTANLSSINNIFMQAMSRIDDNFGIVDSSIIATGALVAQFGMNAMNAFGQFEQGMKIVQMVSGQTANDIDYLSQKANEFSVQYRMDIDQITEGLQTLGRAGLNSASEQAEVLENGLTTAKLEGRDLNGVLEELIQNTALLGGNLQSSSFGEDSQYVNDLLVATSMSAPITTHDVSETLKYSGGIAAAAGANIRDELGNVNEEGKAILEDYMGAIAAFAQKGVTGSIAGTALRAFFNKPATQDESVKEALGAIHLKPEYLWEDDEETMKPISDQIALIKKQMDDLNVSTMDRLQIWSKIVGGKMGQQMMKLDSTDIKELTNDIRSADDASNLAAGSMKTFEANVKAAQESGALLERNIGEVLVAYANPFIDFGNKVLGFLNQDFMAFPLAMGFISFMGAVAVRIKRVFSQIKAEISEVLAALKEGETVTVRDMRGSTKTGRRGSLSSYTVDGAQTPEDYKRAFEEKFAKNSVNAYKGWAPIDIAVAEQTKSWSGMDSDENFQNTAQKYGFSARHNDMIRTIIDQQKMTDEVREILAQKGTKSFKMGTMLDSGITVQEWVKNTYLDIQKDINQSYSNFHKKNAHLWEITDENSAVINENTSATGSNSQSKIENTKLLYSESEINQKKLEQQTEKIRIDREAAQAQEELKNKTIAAAEASQESSLNKEAEAAFEEAAAKRREQYSAPPVLPRDHEAFTMDLDKEIADYQEEQARIALAERVAPFTDFYQRTFSKKKGSQAFYWSNQALGLQMDPTKFIYNNPAFMESFMEGVMPNFTFEDFKRIAVSSKGRIPKAKMQEAYKSYMSHLQGLLNDFTLEQLKNKSISDMTAAELQMAAGQTDGFVQGWRGRKGRTAEDVRRELGIYNDIKGLHPSTLKSMIEEYGVDIGTGKGMSKADRIKMLLPLMSEDLKENTLPLRQRNAIQEQYLRYLAMEAEEKTKIMQQNAATKEKEYQEHKKNYGGQAGSPMSREGKTVDQLIESKKKELKEQEDVVNKIRLASQQSSNLSKEVEKQVNEAKQSTKQMEKFLSKDRSYSPGPVASSNKLWYEDDPDSPYGRRWNFGERPVESKIPTSEELRRRFNIETRPTPTAYTEDKGGFLFGMWDSLKSKWNADRAGRFNFGTKMVDGELRSVTKGLRGFGNGILNATEGVGGPFMIAIMAASTVIQLWQQAFQNYCEDLKKAGEELKDSYSKRDTAESSLRQSYRNKNPDATEEEIDKMVLKTYSTMGKTMEKAIQKGDGEWLKKVGYKAQELQKYEADEEKDDGSVKPVKEEVEESVALDDAIKENTGALYEATAELNSSMARYVRQGQDSWWGISGWTGKLTDSLGGLQDRLESSVFDTDGEKSHFISTRSNFMEDQEFLLTARQKDENYAGYTEMAGLMLQDFKDANGEYLAGLQTMMGDDALTFNNIISQEARDFLSAEAKWASRLTQGNNLRLQTSMKNDTKTWQALAKEIVKRERKTGKKVTDKNQTKKIEGLVSKLNTSMGGGFRSVDIRQAAALMVMQGMLETAKSAILPVITQNSQIAANTLYTTSGMANETAGTGSATSGTEAITSAIAAMVSQIAMAKAAEATYNGILMQDPSKLSGGDLAAYELASQATDANDFMKKAAESSYKGDTLSVDWGKFLNNKATLFDSKGNINYEGHGIYQRSAKDNQKAMDDILLNFGMSGLMSVYGADPLYAKDHVSEAIKKWREEGRSSQQIYESLSKNYQSDTFKKQLTDAYLASGEGDGEGSGGGGGSGSKNKNNDSGTRKERVDLVLCNRKQIPKLNVNLFKKPPSFTILNKNFKLRDVKINSEDKPKAIMAAIKNSFIDIQKRTDPKIIQDENSVYDPLEATEGKDLPSGSSKANKTN